jgi:hypothetical protein
MQFQYYAQSTMHRLSSSGGRSEMVLGGGLSNVGEAYAASSLVGEAGSGITMAGGSIAAPIALGATIARTASSATRTAEPALPVEDGEEHQ